MALTYKIQKLIHINNESHKDKAINQLKVLSKRNHLVNLKFTSDIFELYVDRQVKTVSKIVKG